MLGWSSNGIANSSGSGFIVPLNSCEIKYDLNSAWGFSVQNIEFLLGQDRKIKPDSSQTCTVEAGEAMDASWNMGKFLLGAREVFSFNSGQSHRSRASRMCRISWRYLNSAGHLPE